MKKLLIGLLVVCLVLSVAGNVLLYLRYSTARPLIDVNNDVIRRKDLDDRLDYLYSNNVLREMIVSRIVMAEAKEKGVAPTDKDLSSFEDQLQRSNPEVLEQAAKTDPQLTVFHENVATDLALRNLRVMGISVTGQEVENYYNRRPSQFALPQQSSTTVVFAQDSVSAQMAERMLGNNISPGIVAAQQGLRVAGINASTDNGVPESIRQAVLSMKVGDVREFPVGSRYVVVKVQKLSPAGVPPLQAIRPEVELAARLAKAPTETQELDKLLASSHIKVESDKYAQAVPQESTNMASAR